VVGATEAVRALGVVRAAIESSKRNGESVLLQEVIDKVGTGE
jgi:DNA helicase TIP49 (TBP-interacting protein)